MTTYKRIAAVEKAGQILKFLGNQKEPVSGADIAKAVDLKIGTTMCHLATLADLGFVEIIGDKMKLGMGIGMFWARIKSNLEADRARIDRDLTSISIKEA